MLRRPKTPRYIARAAESSQARQGGYAAARRQAVPYRRAVPLRAPRIHQEFKAIDLDIATTGNGADGLWSVTMGRTCANAISIGAAINQRIGRQITLRSIQLHLIVKADADQTAMVTCRYLIVYDRQCNGALAAGTDVLVAATVNSPKNLDNRERFTIIRDQTFGLLKDTEKAQYTDEYYRKLYHPVTYNAGVAGTYADINTGTLLFLAVSTVATEMPVATGFLRVRYTDD